MLGGGLLNKHNSPKLQKFKENNNKRKVIVTAIIISVLLLSGVYLYSSFAVFTEEKHFNVINGTVQDPGDIYFAYYVDNSITREMPKKGSGYTLDTEKSNCTNGVVPTWDNGGWKFIGDYSGYNATEYTRTRCNLYFKKIDITAVEYIKDLAKYDTETIATDEAGGNIRYIGSNPNNYVWIDNNIYDYDTYQLIDEHGFSAGAMNSTLEICNDIKNKYFSALDYECKKLHSKGEKILWRIIGVMNNIDDGNGNKGSRLKLMRNNSLGDYPWRDPGYSSADYGVNEWSESDIMKLLNPNYDDSAVNNSLFYNSQKGYCSITSYVYSKIECDFTSLGLETSLKKLSDNVLWNTGAVSLEINKINKFYEEERGTLTGKICSNGNWCNDTVTRTINWVGKVGLPYVSDYGYSTAGSNKISRSTCLNTNLNSWQTEDAIDCFNNSWFSKNIILTYFITPVADNDRADGVWYIYDDGTIDSLTADTDMSFAPTVYLKPLVKIVSGTGNSEDPYILGE